MNKIISSKSAKIAAGLVGVVAGFAMIATSVSAATFTTNLKQGSKGADVKNLQILLNMDTDTQVAATGAGSKGMETSSFGPATKKAVIKFQNKYAADTLTPAGLKAGTGFVGALTRAKLNTMGGSTTTTTGSTTTTTTVPAGSGVAVTAGTQPSNGLAIQGASRVAFTKVTLTAGSSDVVVNGITVERQGAATDSNFSGVILLQDDGTQLDIAKTLGSTHQATIGGTFTVKAGTSMTLTIAGNMAASLAAMAGQVASLAVVGVNTSSTVTGSLPIVGAMHTINGTLTIGTVTGSNSSYDPGTTANKAIGTTGYKFTGVRITAGSAEDVRMKSVRFYQAGSASSGDLSNVKIFVDGTSYNTTVSTDGKYYGANFGSGIVIAKGLAKDVYITADITGSGSSGRTIDFDLQKNTDLYLVGETYGQGLIYTGTVNSTVSTATPAINGYAVTVTAGSLTSVAKANSVAAQNIAINLSNQALGGYDTDLTGEPISVQSHVFHFATSSASTGASAYTSISLYNENGAVVAGPVDAVADGVSAWKVTFTDTVTYPIGKHTYTLKGKIPTGASNGAVITTTTTPSSDWTSITGQTTGNTISLSGNGLVTMNAMTVKSAALAISLSPSPAAQTVVAGSQVTFANIQLDASASGEDVRFSSLALTKASVTGLSTCQLFDGATALNTGSNVLNPAITGAETISFDSSLTVAKNTVKTLTLKCNSTSAATGTYTWTITPSLTNPTVTGVTSGSSVTATGAAATSAIQTIGTGSLVVSTSPSSPSYANAAAGSTGNAVAVLRFRAANEGVNLSRIGLTLTNTASSSASDLVQVSIWDGATQVGTATFTGTNSKATSTLTTTVALPKDADKDLTVKVDLAQVGTGFTGTQGALIAIDVDTNGTNTQGTGAGSGSTINATGSTAVSGIRLFKSFPTFALGTIGSTGVADGKLMRFTVTANANGGIGLDQFKFTVATTSASVTGVNLFGYTDSGYSAAISGFTSGQISTSNVSPTATAFTISPSAVINVPAGTTYYFEARGTVTASQTTYSVTTTLSGDAAYPSAIGYNAYAAGGTAMMASTTPILAGNNLVWSPNATTTSGANHVDWTNGYGVNGLPSSGLIQTRSN